MPLHNFPQDRFPGLLRYNFFDRDAMSLPTLPVPRVDDFEVSGDGTHASWSKAEWATLGRFHGERPYETRFKVLYSATGLYVFMHNSDRKITAPHREDFMDLFDADVCEIFLWPDERYPLYFEYEISPLGRELVLLVPRLDGEFFGWRPWHYENDRCVLKKTAAIGGSLEHGATIEAWTCEVCIPFELLKPLCNVPPRPGMQWRANFYRIDHDDDEFEGWHWAPVVKDFHEYERFGTLLFE